LLDRDRLGSRNHEDAIYPTTKLSMINTALNARGHILQEPAEQEARTKLPHGFHSKINDRNSESRSCFALSRKLVSDFVPPILVDSEASG